ncbi:hypothetical protein O3P69_014124 [Scylla paramamosain]|uniref:Serine palmitoyltransferase 1 n=1 Tax=Scylla paramamosain TaxID=85552 RepID=A0AAW0SB01_SCYPA
MVNFSLQRGLQASRSKVIYFRHNDLGHLEELLEAQERQDAKDPKRANATRKFVVVEGIYMNTGRLCDLPGLVTLRQRYRLRLFLDEAVSFATLGSHCRGITDHFNVPMKEVDLLMGTLEGAGGCAGGFCVGTKFVVEHQRLSGLGYCFSASLPPMLAAASIKAVDLLEREGPELVEALQRACTHTHTALTATLPDSVEVGGDEISPIKHLRLTRPCSDDEAEVILRQVVEQAQEEGVALTVAAYLRAQEREAPRPSIRVSVSAALSQEEIENAVGAISRAFQKKPANVDILGYKKSQLVALGYNLPLFPHNGSGGQHYPPVLIFLVSLHHALLRSHPARHKTFVRGATPPESSEVPGSPKMPKNKKNKPAAAVAMTPASTQEDDETSVASDQTESTVQLSDDEGVSEEEAYEQKVREAMDLALEKSVHTRINALTALTTALQKRVLTGFLGEHHGTLLDLVERSLKKGRGAEQVAAARLASLLVLSLSSMPEVEEVYQALCPILTRCCD